MKGEPNSVPKYSLLMPDRAGGEQEPWEEAAFAFSTFPELWPHKGQCTVFPFPLFQEGDAEDSGSCVCPLAVWSRLFLSSRCPQVCLEERLPGMELVSGSVTSTGPGHRWWMQPGHPVHRERITALEQQQLRALTTISGLRVR